MFQTLKKRSNATAGGNRRALGRQLVLALLSALSAGYYLAFEFLPDQKLVQTFVVAGTLCAAALLVLMNSPALLQSASATPSHLALLPVAWTFFFGLALALQVRVLSIPYVFYLMHEFDMHPVSSFEWFTL